MQSLSLKSFFCRSGYYTDPATAGLIHFRVFPMPFQPELTRSPIQTFGSSNLFKEQRWQSPTGDAPLNGQHTMACHDTIQMTYVIELMSWFWKGRAFRWWLHMIHLIAVPSGMEIAPTPNDHTFPQGTRLCPVHRSLELCYNRAGFYRNNRTWGKDKIKQHRMELGIVSPELLPNPWTPISGNGIGTGTGAIPGLGAMDDLFYLLRKICNFL